MRRKSSKVTLACKHTRFDSGRRRRSVDTSLRPREATLTNGTDTLNQTSTVTREHTTMVRSKDTTDKGTGTEQHMYTTIVDPRCSEICKTHSAAGTNATISAVDSTTVPRQTTKPTTVMHPDIASKWGK